MSTEKTTAIKELIANPLSRRAFAQRAMTTGLIAAVGAGITGLQERVEAQSLTDADILNFALNLEYLEAEFYTVATTGRRINDTGTGLGVGITGTGASGATTGGAQVALDNRVMQVAMDIASDERAHVTLLRSALGSAAIAKPAINLEALGIGFRSQNEFLTLARAFEDTGETAYVGAAPLISNRNVLATAAAIGLTEGQHGGVLRYLVYDRGVVVPQLDNLDIPPLASPNGRVFNVFSDGRTPARTPSQVLAIVYANRTPGASSGGFFPSGVNGIIRSV